MNDSATVGSWTTSSSWSSLEDAVSTTAAAVDRFGARDSALVRAEVAVQAVIFVVTVVGNVLVIAALWLQARERQIRRRLTLQGGVPPPPPAPPSDRRDGRRLHSNHHHHQHHHGRLRLSRMDFMILHLTIADLSVAGFTVLPQLVWDALGQFPGNDLLCRSVAYLQVVNLWPKWLNGIAFRRKPCQKPFSELRSFTCRMESPRVTCHPTQTRANALYHNLSQTGRYSIYLPRRDGRLS